MPSGRKTGHRCEFSPRSMSRSVAGSTAPPSADTFASPSKIGVRPNTIVPVGLHAPPFPSGASQIGTGTPPATTTFISFPRAKNPSEVPSATRTAASLRRSHRWPWHRASRSDRTNRRGAEPPLTAVNATRRPTGETIGAESSAVPAGSDHVNCVRSGATDWFCACWRSRPPMDAARTAATAIPPAIARRPERKNRRPRVTGAGAARASDGSIWSFLPEGPQQVGG